VLVTLFLRFETVRLTEVISPLRADALDYMTYAANLVEHGVYSRDARGISEGITPEADGVRAAGYPVFMAPFLAMLGLDAGAEAVKYGQALLSAGLVLLVFLAARRCLPWWGAFAVTLMTALSPHLINMNVYWLTESLFAFLLTASLLAMTRCIELPGRLMSAAVAGLVFGLCFFTRPTVALLLVPWLALMFLYQGRAALVGSTVLLAAVVAVPVLWMLTYAPPAVEGGSSLLRWSIHHGLYPGFMFEGNVDSYGFPYRYDPRSPEIAASWPALLDELARRFGAEPGRHLGWFLWGKPQALLSWDIVQGMGDAFVYPVSRTPYFELGFFAGTHRISAWLHAPAMLLAVIGSLLVWWNSWRQGWKQQSLLVPQLASLLLLYFIAIHMVVAPFPRYGIPLRPVCYLLAVWTGWQLWLQIQSRLRARVPAEQS
jgi:4-amino-4-deoxy-L-arabinose transferase-like glycosyltransferase